MAEKTFDELLSGAQTIRDNELPESNTHALVGEQLVNMVDKIKEEDSKLAELSSIWRYIENEEYLYALVDGTGKLLFGIRSDGEIIEGKLPLHTRKAIENLREVLGRNVLAISMDRETGRLIGYTGNDSNIRNVIHDRVTGRISIIQTIK